MIRFACPSCGATLGDDPHRAGQRSQCPDCRAEFVVPDAPAVRPSRRVYDADDASADSKRVPAGAFAVLLGGLGVHKFYLGYPLAGVVLLALWLFCFFFGVFCFLGWFGSMALHAVGVVEGIVYLAKSDREFVRTYQHGRRAWF